LKEHLLTCDASCESLLEDVRAFARDTELQDDATVISVKLLD